MDAALESDVRRPGAKGTPQPVTIALVLCALFAWLLAQRDFGPDGYFIPLKGLAILAAGFAPGLFYLARLRRDPASAEPLPYFPLLGVIFGIYYGLPVLLRDRVRFMSLEPNPVDVADALDLAILGLAALYLGFGLVGPRVLSGNARRPLSVPWDEERARNTAVVLVAVGVLATIASEVVEIPHYLVQVVRVLTLMLRVGLGIFVILALKGRLPRLQHLLLWTIAIPIYLFIHIRTGQIGALMRPVVFTLLLVWAYRLRLPWLAIAFFAACAILLRGTASEFRSMVHRSHAVAELSSFQRSALYVDIVRKNLVAHPGDTLSRSLDLIASRTAQLGLFAHTVHRTPEAVPYWNGETYKTLPSSFVPRFIWRDKPTKELGQRFGHRYAVLEPEDRITSVNLPQMVELFVNFGALGVLFGMLGLGVLYRLAYFKLNDPGAGDGTTLIGAIIFSELINIESDFSLVFGGLVQIAVILFVVLRNCAPRRRRVVHGLALARGAEAPS